MQCILRTVGVLLYCRVPSTQEAVLVLSFCSPFFANSSEIFWCSGTVYSTRYSTINNSHSTVLLYSTVAEETKSFQKMNVRSTVLLAIYCYCTVRQYNDIAIFQISAKFNIPPTGPVASDHDANDVVENFFIVPYQAFSLHTRKLLKNNFCQGTASRSTQQYLSIQYYCCMYTALVLACLCR